MKVTLLALTARGAMAHYLDALAPALAGHVDVRVVAPEHYADTAERAVPVVGFAGPSARAARAVVLANPLGASAVWDPIAAAGPDVIHILVGSDLPWGAVVARRARRAGIPVIATLHSPDRLPGDRWWMAHRIVREATLRTASAFHVHADVWKRKLVQSGISERRVYTIPHGSFAPRFARHMVAGVEREPLALFFGRIAPYKGVDHLVAATLRFPGGVRTAIAGPGRLSSGARRLIAQRPDLFELHPGYRSDEEIARLLQRASVCVFPYVRSTQSSGPLIAACTGVPVVASSVGALAEDVPRVGGVLVPPADNAALADGVARALGTQPVCPADLQFPALAELFVNMYRSVT